MIEFRKIVFLLSCVSMASCETSLLKNSESVDTASVAGFGWYYKLSPIDLTATLDPNEITIWHGRQGTTPYSTEADCISAGKKSIENIWNYKVECREQVHPSQIPIQILHLGELEIAEDK